MSAVIQLPTQEPTTALDYALAYAGLGWHVFPAFGIRDGACSCGNPDCKNPGKHPIGWLARKGQDDATTDPARILAWWTAAPDANVAIMLKPSGLVAIDIDPRNGGWDSIDDLEAKHGGLVSDVLQLTGGGGEHRIFRLDPDEGLALPGKLGAGVDVKRNGYIIAEPSTHISGRTYQWEASSNPLEGVMPPPLPDWLRGTFGGASAAPTLPPAEPRALTEQDRADLQSALQAIPSDDREDWVQVGMALHSTAAGGEAFMLWDAWSRTCPEKYDARDCTRVWASFRNKGLAGVSKATIFAMAQARGWVNKRPEPPIEVDASVAPPDLPKVAPAKSNLSTIPVRMLQDVATWMGGLSEKFHPDIAIVGALALGSVITGRLYRSEYANWTSLLFVVSGPSGVGKNFIQVGVERLLIAAGLQKLIAGDFYTHQSALYSALRKAPAHICISDEFGENFLEARKNNNSNKMTVFKAFKKVYSAADHMFKAESYSMLSKAGKDEDIGPVLNPSLTLVGLTTPLQFYSEIKTSHIEGGLMNRLIILNTGPEKVRERAQKSDEAPEAIVEWIKVVHRSCDVYANPPYDMAAVPTVVRFSDDATETFRAFGLAQEATSRELETQNMDSMPMRWRENAMRLATMLAACNYPAAPLVTGDHAQWACDYVQSCGMSTIRALGANAGENDYQQQMNRVLEFVRAAGQDGRSATEISRHFRSIKKRDMEAIKDHLVESGLFNPPAERKTGGRAVRIWVAASFPGNKEDHSQPELPGEPHE